MSVSHVVEGLSNALTSPDATERSSKKKYVVADSTDNIEAGKNDVDGKHTDFFPYIKTAINGTSKTTRYISHADANPEWNETLVFTMNPETQLQKLSKRETEVNLANSNAQQASNQVETVKDIEEVWLTFEAWHRDLTVSFDDHIGDGTLALEMNAFNQESWSTHENIRLVNERGIGVGSLNVTLKWKKTNMNLIDATIDSNSSTKAQKLSENIALGDSFPEGTFSVTIERAVHLIDPNHTSGLAITRSTQLLIYSTALVVSYFALGALVYLSFEGPNSEFADGVNNTTKVVKFRGIVDSLYFSVCTFTTVGYGDVVPQGDLLKIFTVFYSLCGVAIVAVGVNVMVNSCMASTNETCSHLGYHYCPKWKGKKIKILQKAVTAATVRRKLFGLLFKMMGVIAVGTVAYMMPGMIQKGQPGLSFVDSLYMSTMTASSIGFGDLSPKSDIGRLFFVVWMIGGYVIVASSIREISQLYLELKERQAERRILNRKVGVETLGMDGDGDGVVDKFEYLSHMVVVLGKMDVYEVREIMKRFHELDVTGDGKLSKEDFDKIKIN